MSKFLLHNTFTYDHTAHITSPTPEVRGSNLCFLFQGLLCVLSASAQHTSSSPATPPVRILKQVNRQNEDGSYTYGYQNEDGSYKIETKSATGEIVGKYGYVDVDGKAREIEYGASNRGFEPVGPGITVPPPTLHQQNSNNNVEADYDDGQYHEDPSIYYKTDAPTTIPKYSLAPVQRQQVQPQQVQPQQVQPQAQTADFVYEATLNGQPARYQQWYRPQYQVDLARQYRGQPAGNIDLYSGSYSVNLSG